MYALRDYTQPRIELLPRLQVVYPVTQRLIYPEAFVLGHYAARSTPVFIKPMNYYAATQGSHIRVLKVERVIDRGSIRYAATCYIRETGRTKMLMLSQYTQLQVGE